MNLYTPVLTEVFCTVLFEGIHNCPNCPIEEVSYLKDPHRHIFHIKAFKQVNHNDRDVEFIWLKHRVQEFLTETYPNGQMGPTSCEMLAHILIGHFDLTKCEVSEDNENGAVVELQVTGVTPS